MEPAVRNKADGREDEGGEKVGSRPAAPSGRVPRRERVAAFETVEV